jgi:predicted glycoside hydrolase/deacetylase ChbG (UPF0249 family)
MTEKNIILCADDFGQNASISEGIIDLCHKGRINAVSCMVNGEAFLSHIEALKTTGVSLGLHLNLTHGKALISGEPHLSLGALLQTIYLSRVFSQDDVYAEVHAQIKAFKQVVGFYPQFIDGHQHVHQLPIVRDALMQAVSSCGFHPWFRTTYSDITKVKSFKALLLYLLGGKKFAKVIRQSGFATCQGFTGEYPLHQGGKYRSRFKKFLIQIPDGGLIMCHPGLISQDPQDPIASIRFEEYDYLSSPEFISDLKDANTTAP